MEKSKRNKKLTKNKTKNKKSARYWKDRAIRMEEEKEQLAQKLSKRTQNAYIRSFMRLENDIDSLLAEVQAKGPDGVTRTELYNLQKYVKLRNKIAKEVGGLATKDSKALDRLLYQIAVDTYKSNLEEFGIDFSMFSEQQAKAIASQNWTGVKFSDRIWGHANEFNARVMTDLEEMIVQGKSPDRIKKKLMEDYSSKFHEADRLIRTEASHAYNTAALQSYMEAGCEQVDFLAEKDCCELCEPYSGKRYPAAYAPTIPVHPNCRCTYLPVVPGITS